MIAGERGVCAAMMSAVWRHLTSGLLAMSSRFEPTLGERLNYAIVALDPLSGQRPERIIRPLRIAIFAGPRVTCDVEVHERGESGVWSPEEEKGV